MKDDKEVLLAAADHIERVGWYQGWFYSNLLDRANSPCCVMGAVIACADDQTQVDRIWNKLNDVVNDGTAVWNDQPERTQGEVVGVLREAAED